CSLVEERACPELEIQSAPELEARVHLAATVLLQPRARRVRLYPAALAERLRRKRVGGKVAELPVQPPLLGCDEPELVDPVAHERRKEIAQRAPQHRLGPAALDEFVAFEGEHELDQAIVEERYARLERVSH